MVTSTETQRRSPTEKRHKRMAVAATTYNTVVQCLEEDTLSPHNELISRHIRPNIQSRRSLQGGKTRVSHFWMWDFFSNKQRKHPRSKPEWNETLTNSFSTRGRSVFSHSGAICMLTYTHTHTHTSTQLFTCTFMFIQTEIPSLTYMPSQHTHIHTYIQTYTQTIHTCHHSHTCTHTYIHTYIQTYIYTYIHAYIHAYMQNRFKNISIVCIQCKAARDGDTGKKRGHRNFFGGRLDRKSTKNHGNQNAGSSTSNHRCPGLNL